MFVQAYNNVVCLLGMYPGVKALIALRHTMTYYTGLRSGNDAILVLDRVRD